MQICLSAVVSILVVVVPVLCLDANDDPVLEGKQMEMLVRTC